MKVTSTALAVAVAVVAGAAGTWACVPGGGGGSGKKLSVTPAQARPGAQITVSVPSSAASTPIELRFNASDGPVLGSIPAGGPGAGAGSVDTIVTVPPDAKPGQNAVIAVQPGQRWEPVLLGVALADGTVPDAVHSSAQRTGGDGAGGRTVLWAVVAVAVLGLGAVPLRSILRSRRSRAHVPTLPEAADEMAPADAGSGRL